MFDIESFEYFKLRRDLEEVAIMKSVPNFIIYLHKYSQNFSPFLSIFLMLEISFGVYFF
jgi:hypothetical protein